MTRNILLSPPLDSLPLGSKHHVQRAGLRDYIVVFRSNKWHLLTTDEFYDIVQKVQNVEHSDIFVDALIFFYRHAPQSYRRVIDGELYSKALTYLNLYTSLITSYFPNLISYFKPKTIGKIGFVGEILIHRRLLGVHGFRPIGNMDEEILFLPVGRMGEDPQVLYSHGVDNLKCFGSANGFVDIDVKKEVIHHELINQLVKLVKAGNLNELNTPEMLAEFILGVLSSHPEIFRCSVKTQRGRGSIIFPVRSEIIFRDIYREKLTRYFTNQRMQSRFREEKVLEDYEKDGLHITVLSTGYSEADRSWVDDMVNQELTQGSSFQLDSTHDVGPYGMEEALSFALRRLDEVGYLIDEPIFPEEDLILNSYFNDQSMSSIIKDFVKKLYSKFLENYKVIVELNFPKLKQYFQIYSKMPVHVLIHVSNSHQFSKSWLSTYYFHNQFSSTNLVEILNDCDFEASNDLSLSYRGKIIDAFYLQNRRFGSIFYPIKQRSKLIKGGKFNALRALIYEEIERELPTAIDAFCTENHVDKHIGYSSLFY